MLRVLWLTLTLTLWPLAAIAQLATLVADSVSVSADGDLIVANDISRTDAGFEVDENAVLFVWPLF